MGFTHNKTSLVSVSTSRLLGVESRSKELNYYFINSVLDHERREKHDQ